MQFLYNVVAIILVTAAVPIFIYRFIREKGFGERIRQSLGFLPPEVLDKVANKNCIWLHAASVGEIVATSPIVKEIRREMPDSTILVSVVTASGYEMAKRIIPEAQAVIFFPLDLPTLAHSVVKKIRPGIFMPVETELWPNFLAAIRVFKIPVMMVNGRISDKSVKRYHYLRGVLTDMINTVTKFCMQSNVDAEYIIRLGAKPELVTVTGNTKFDQTYTDVTGEERQKLVEELAVGGSCPVILAGSTHKGEEEILLKVAGELKNIYPNSKLIIAPRDIMRVEEIMRIAAGFNLTAVRRTELAKSEVLRKNPFDVVLLDTIGELGKVYSIGDIIYVGGSLVPRGGHNVLEPAAHGKPIIVGPHMFNFKDSYALFTKRNACATVHNAAELKEIIISLLKDDERRKSMCENSLAIINENRGAAKKSVAYLKEILNLK